LTFFAHPTKASVVRTAQIAKLTIQFDGTT